MATAATLATVPTNASVNAPITGVTDTLTPANAMAFACLYTSAADVGSRVAFTGTAVPALTPTTAASYTIRLYAAATGGVALAESAAIAVSATQVGPALTMTNPVYAAAPAGFGQQLTGGSGSAAVTMPGPAFTLECFLTLPASDTAYHLMVGLGPNIFLAINNSGKIGRAHV